MNLKLKILILIKKNLKNFFILMEKIKVIKKIKIQKKIKIKFKKKIMINKLNKTK